MSRNRDRERFARPKSDPIGTIVPRSVNVMLFFGFGLHNKLRGFAPTAVCVLTRANSSPISSRIPSETTFYALALEEFLV